MREKEELRCREEAAKEEIKRKQQEIKDLKQEEKELGKDYDLKEKMMKKDFKEEKSSIKETVTKTTDVDVELIGKVRLEEEKPSFLNRLTRKVKKMFNGNEIEIDEEYDADTGIVYDSREEFTGEKKDSMIQ